MNKSSGLTVLSIVLCFIIPVASIGQYTNLDCRLIDLGPLRQTVTNMATFGSGWTYCVRDYPFTQNIDFDKIRYHYQPGWTEYPAGSNCWYVFFAPWIGAVAGGQKLVSTGGPEWMEYDCPVFCLLYEFFPTQEPWDSIWVVNRGETADIPYWPGYTGVSDMDFVTRFNDYTVKNVRDHIPLNIDVIQVTYSWTSLEFLVHQYWVIPKLQNLSDVYFAFVGEMSIGCVNSVQMDQQLSDEYSWYDQARNLGITQDLPGKGDDDCVKGPIGFTILPDTNETQTLQWAWYDGMIGQEYPNTDPGRYVWFFQGINHDPVQSQKAGDFFYAVGLFQVPVGDTLHLTVGQIYGQGLEGLYKNHERLLQVRAQKYHMPAPPPSPAVRMEIANHQVTLRWDPRPGDVNPETFQDPYRGDKEQDPFEGYRVYKSTTGVNGPWKLLAEFDRDDDVVGPNTGLQYQYTDVGLLNNFEYHYAVTTFAKPDTTLGISNLESGIPRSTVLGIPGTSAPETVGKVAVVPNPYRGDARYYDYNPPWEKAGVGGSWTEETRHLQFINLPNPCRVKIYTVSGIYVATINHDDPQRGFADWNLTSFVGQAISSGVYLFTVEDLKTGAIQTGKFVIIK